jgi:hypothetical protein
LNRKRVYDRADLDRYADTLPYEQKEGEPCDVADQVWGAS